MRFYLWLENTFDAILRKVWVLVVWIHETRKIWKKKRLYAKAQLHPAQVQEIDKLWQQGYGRKISYNWHKLYQSFTGKFDALYFPEILYTTKLEVLMNPRHVARALSDKNLLNILFRDDYVKVPKTIVANARGYLYDENHNLISKKKMLEILHNAGEVIIKPTINTDSGRGITVHNIQNGIDLLSGESVNSLIAKLKDNYVVQEKLVAHPAYAKIYEKSINTIRVVTYIVADSVHHGPLFMRIGRAGSFVDNINAGGIFIGLTDEGWLNKVAFSEEQDRFSRHPDSGFIFEGYKVPETLQVIEAAKRLHGRLPGLGIISWDFMIDKDENVVLVECNLDSQDTWATQMANGRSLFGNNSLEMMKMIS